jgi:hypothetical protein
MVRAVLDGLRVVNELVWVTAREPGDDAVAVTVYLVETASAQVLCQDVRAVFIVPATCSPAALTDTCERVPRAEVTVMPSPGLTAVLPLAGVIVTCGPVGLLLAEPPEPSPPEPPLAPEPPVPPEQAAASRPASAIAAIAAGRLRRDDGAGSGATGTGAVLTGGPTRV